jgi:hypothetical protein
VIAALPLEQQDGLITEVKAYDVVVRILAPGVALLTTAPSAVRKGVWSGKAGVVRPGKLLTGDVR